ncbi:catechol 2,3-dioxygenase [Immundisolibacter sp.]
MAMTGILRPGHVQLRVLELGPALHHYKEMVGLIETARDADGRVYLKAWDEQDLFSIVLRESDRPGMDFYGFKVLDAKTLEHYAKRLTDYGVAIERIPAGDLKGTGERVRFETPSGHLIELYAEKQHFGNGLPDVNPDVWPDGLKGMHPSRFDHVLLNGDSIPETARLFREALDFDLSERIVGPDGSMVGAFLSCSTKAHDIAFIHEESKGRLHHVSFHLESWDEIRHAADIMSKNYIPVEYGPGRHGLTRGLTIYFFDPSGNRNETFHGGYIRYPDHPLLTWTHEEVPKGIFYYGHKMVESFVTANT